MASVLECPDDNQLAAFFEGTISDGERQQLEHHFDVCDDCRLFAGVAVVDQDDGLPAEAPTAPMLGKRRADAKAPTKPERRPRRARGDVEPLKAGDLVDHFQVIEIIGEGGMGRVYLARDRTLRRRVALKLVQPALGSSKKLVRMFHREARATAKLSHPHIVTIHSVGEHEGLPYVALEYVDGGSLEGRLVDEERTQLDVMHIALGLAEGLSEAHAHGIVHKDLKPANVLLGKEGRARIADFGLAHVAARRVDADSGPTDHDTFLHTVANSPSEVGTPSYMAPEQWRGEPVTGETDVWALGVILWELLAGKRLFVGRSEVELVGQICGTAPIPALPVEVTPALRALAMRCLQRRADHRPAAKEVAEELRRQIRLLEAAEYGEGPESEPTTLQQQPVDEPDSDEPPTNALPAEAPTLPIEDTTEKLDERSIENFLAEDRPKPRPPFKLLAGVAVVAAVVLWLGFAPGDPLRAAPAITTAVGLRTIDALIATRAAEPTATSEPSARPPAGASGSPTTPPANRHAPKAAPATSEQVPELDIFEGRH